MAEEKPMLPDAEDVGLADKDLKSEDEKNEATLSLWKKRFTQAENFRKPIIAKYLRMYKLYRAYRDAVNYAYGTNIMPPIGFEVIETVKPRLASAKINVNILPKQKDDINSPSLKRWDDLIEYDFEKMMFDDLKIQWINAMLLYGNGYAQLSWAGDEDGDPFLEIVDNWLLYFDPTAGNRLYDSNWEIKQSFKPKAILKKEEKERGENKLYDKIKNWDDIEDQEQRADDPRKDRYQINTLKMGQINDNIRRGQATDAGPGETGNDKYQGERNIEIWECWDHVEDKLVVIFNREHVARDEENPYMKVRKGRLIIDLPDISLNNEAYAMGHLEPIETIIHEIADSRNQAMDDIVFSLDPIKKIRRGKGYKVSDLKHAPGATWELDKADDVVIERPPEISRAWIEKDSILRKDIESALAMSEYVRGLPQSPNEPSSKVELLLMQTNIRFSLLVRQLEISYTDLVNMLIEMNNEFLSEKKAFRLTGTSLRFAEFTEEDKKVMVDATVDIEPKKEKSPEQESSEVATLYKNLVVDDKPDPNSEDEIEQWKAKKALLQKMMVEKYGYAQYADILAPDYTPRIKGEEETSVQAEGQGQEGVATAQVDGGESIADNPEQLQKVAGPEELLPPDEGILPEVATVESQPSKTLRKRIASLFKRN